MPDPYEIALWRYEQIATLVDESLDPAFRRAALRERNARRVPWPGGLEKTISRATLHRWVRACRSKGIAGLVPRSPTRPDTGEGADRRASYVQYAIALLYEQPNRSLTQLQTYLAAEFEDYSLSRPHSPAVSRPTRPSPGSSAFAAGAAAGLDRSTRPATRTSAGSSTAKGPFSSVSRTAPASASASSR